MEEAADRVEGEIWRRGVEGVEEPVGWYQGTAGGTVRRYSDALLIVKAKAMRPERYRDNYAIEQGLAALETAFVELAQHAAANRNGADPAMNRLPSPRR